VGEVLNLLNTEISSHQRTQPALALEAIYVRDEIRDACAIPPQEAAVTANGVWSQNLRIGQILEQMPAAKHKRALQSFKDANPSLWHEAVLAGLNSVSAKICSECTHLLIEEGKLDQLKELLARLISQHQASSELLLWLAKERSDTFADILGPEVFRAMLTAMERDQFNEKKSNRLRDFILDDQKLLVELIESADIEVIKDLTRALQLSPSFDDMDKRSARIVKHFRDTTDDWGYTKQESTRLSPESLERRKEEYNELVKKKSRQLQRNQIARSYGDLRETMVTAAKEMQKR
jgi:hypothetical protein